jgi:hypothetical protein
MEDAHLKNSLGTCKLMIKAEVKRVKAYIW